MKKVERKGPQRIKDRSIDPLGEALWDEKNNSIIKECSSKEAQHLDSHSVQTAVSEGLIAKFTKQPLDAGQRVRVSTAPLKFNSVGSVIRGSHKFEAGELPNHLRREAARIWIRINKLLIKDGLCLIDAHTGNFAIDGNSKLTWVDLGSIQPFGSGLEGIREYRSYYEFPLKIIKNFPEMSPFVRSGLNKGHRLYRRGYSYFTKIPVIQFKKFGLLMGSLTILHRNGVSVPARVIRSISLAFLELRLPKRWSKDFWQKYPNRDSYPNTPSESREKAVTEALGKLGGSTILDVSGGNGKFLWLARKDSCTHLLTGREDEGVSKFTEFVSRASDVIPANSAFTGLVRDFRSLQFQADIVLALEITHDLALGQWWTFESIADHLYKLSNKYVVVEFMPNGVGKYQSQYFETPDWYSLENFVEAFESRFSNVQIIEETRNSNRVLITCKK